MARSLISGLLASGYEAARIRASDPSDEQRETAAALGIEVTADNAAAVTGAGVVVMAVKPQVMGAVMAGLPLDQAQLVISIAAGVPIASIERWSAVAQPVVRCMPNTPALLGAGITGMFANRAVDLAGRALAERILGAAGRTLWLDQEDQLDAVTAVSGSGPAYFFYLMEAMIEAGEALGLSRAIATELTLETAYGAALMARQREAEPARLRQNVTSPGGTTERALRVLDDAGVRTTIGTAVRGAAERARELAREFGRS
jgi:pyrroline-5-carboxylate reductase